MSKIKVWGSETSAERSNEYAKDEIIYLNEKLTKRDADLVDYMERMG